MKQALCVTLLTAFLAVARQTAAPVAFEAASVKAASPSGNFNPPYKRATPLRVEYRNYPLTRLIAEAYDLSSYPMEAPSWMEREHYEITATKPRHTSVDDTRQMMQSLLIDRFQLVTHRSTKEMPLYHLLPEKVRLLRPERDEPDVPGCKSFGTLAEFAEIVARNLKAPVIDKTNIPGTYYFILAYSPTLASELPLGSTGAPRAL